MKNIYLVHYSVKGIKTIDQLVSLSFYKKTFLNNPDTQNYNVKGIYGINGSGKSGIITSVDIFKNLLINPEYLNNPIVQKNLNEMINKKTEELLIEAQYIVQLKSRLIFFKYGISLTREQTGKYVISHEELSSKNATSKTDSMEPIFEVVNGEIVFIKEEKNTKLIDVFLKKTINLLSTTSMCALFYEKCIDYVKKNKSGGQSLFDSLTILFLLGRKIHVYLDEADDHTNYLLYDSFGHLDNNSSLDYFVQQVVQMNIDQLNIISVSNNVVPKESYGRFEKIVGKLCKFLQIFKYDLLGIEIDKKVDHDVYVCNLIMVYDSFKIHAEFESTGIKKLIRLYAYLKEMAQGGIVFIDEFDSNLHDVYLCALLEYLMEYGEGQLCFTTHNVGPMDILRRNKKSIDFLSADHKIYSWTTNGNYSPSKLYRNGMIEGSPFNVDSIDFIGVFSPEEEDEQ